VTRIVRHTSMATKKFDERERVAKQIALTSESIRKKHRALKTGQQEEEIVLEKRFKPIVEPLKQLDGNTQSSIDNISIATPSSVIKKSHEEINEKTNDASPESIIRKPLKPLNLSKVTPRSPGVRSAPPEPHGSFFAENVPMDIYETDDPPESPIQQVIQSPEIRDALLNQLGTLGQKYVSALLSGDKTIDHVYGVYYNDASGMMLGDKSFDVDKKDNIIVGNKMYAGTPGLYELIFKRIPSGDLFTERDRRVYRNILLTTNAHRRGRDPKLPILARELTQVSPSDFDEL